MDSDGLTECLLIFAAIALKAFFSAAENAVTEISDAKVKGFEKGSANQKSLFRLLKKPSRLINAFAANRIFSAVIIAYLAYAFYAPPLNKALSPMGKLAPFVAAAIILVATVFVLTFFCDGLPKRLVTKDNCEKLAVFCVPAVNTMIILLTPLTALSGLLTGLVARLSGSSAISDGNSVTEEEILMMVDAGNETGVIEADQKEMINNVFSFDSLRISDIMTHRTDITAVDTDAKITDVVAAAIDSGFSRIPVYKDSIDRITGIICVKDLLCMVGSDAADSAKVSDFIREAVYIPETVSCGSAFKLLTEKKMQIAVVIDEYGGTAGIVTMEDIVESIVGNIQDEYDDETEDIVLTSDGTYLINGTAEPEAVLEKLGITLPEDNDFDTVSGFIVSLLGRIPDKNEAPSVSFGNCTFTVLVTEDMCITKVKAVIHNENEQNNDKKKENKNNET